VILLVAVAVLFYVAMTNFKSVAPSALEIKQHNDRRASGEPEPQPAATSTAASADSWTPTPPARPNLSEMEQKTSEHASDVQGALSRDN